jgi:hypothetical protein
VAQETAAQSPVEGLAIELAILPGYQANADIGTDEGELEIGSGANFTASLSFARPSQPGLRGEFSYSQQRVGFDFTAAPGDTSSFSFDADIRYFLLGALYGYQASPRNEPFAGLYLGAMHASPVGKGYDNETFFAFSLVGGVKSYLSRRVGLRLQSRLLTPISISSGSLFCTNGRCAVSINSGTILWQGDFSAGVIYRF